MNPFTWKWGEEEYETRAELEAAISGMLAQHLSDSDCGFVITPEGDKHVLLITASVSRYPVVEEESQ